MTPRSGVQRRGVTVTEINKQRGKVGWLLLWLIGVPVPVLIILFLIRGCT
jgi:hypothetical protein